jgi:hypothetical protein
LWIDRLSIASSARGITGPTSNPAALRPVNGAPSPARCSRTTVSKMHCDARAGGRRVAGAG